MACFLIDFCARLVLCSGPSLVLLNYSAPTDLERADGASDPEAQWQAPSTTVKSLATAFDQHFAPSCRQPRTRAESADYWRAWLLVITWAVARKAVELILPMSLDTLKALTRDLVCFAVPSSQVEIVWKAVRALHQQFQLPQQLVQVNQYSVWVRMLGLVRGRPTSLKLPNQKATIRWLLAWQPANLAGHRASLFTCVATLAWMRVNEVCRSQVCDLWFDYLTSYGVPGFESTCSVHIDSLKNDTERKGNYPAFGCSVDPSLDITRNCKSGCGSPAFTCERTARSGSARRHTQAAPVYLSSPIRVVPRVASLWSQVDPLLARVAMGRRCRRARTCRSARPAASLRRSRRLDSEWGLGKLLLCADRPSPPRA